jgi:type IV pilus assembly protein PilW
MNVLYGVDVTGDGSVDEYLPANSVAAWTTVKTVNTTLIFTNPLNGQPGQPATVSLTQTIPYMNGL